MIRLALILSLCAAPALAHTGHGDAAGLLHGLAHPLLGADHLLAMLAVGLWSGLALPGRVGIGAATFLAAMAAGAGLGWAGIGLPGVEAAVLLSVVTFGVLVLTARAGRGTALSLFAIAGFAACHGQAHATEAAGNVAGYLAGFLIATGALHVAGIGIARAVSASPTPPILQRILGAGVAASGLWMVAG